MRTSTHPGRSPRERWFRWLALSAAVSTFLLIVIGGLVRVTGSGLGCPDWPTCYGAWIPPFQFEAIVEYSHRLVAFLTSPLILATAAWAWWKLRHRRWIAWPALISSALLAFQVVLGGVTVLLETPPVIVAVHLGNALLILGLQIGVAVNAFEPDAFASDEPELSLRYRLARLAAATGAMLFLVLVSGAFVTSSGAAGSCAGWPLCDGRFWPRSLLGQVHMLHRIVVGVGAVMVLGLAGLAWPRRRNRPAVFISATVTAALLLAQILVGAANVLRGFPPVLNGLHVATASAVWGMGVVTLVYAARRPSSPSLARLKPSRGTGPSVAEYLALTKPIIVGLLLVTTLAAMIVAAGALPDWPTVVWTLLGGALSAGGAGALNQYTDRQLDRSMARTARRPLPKGSLEKSEALTFGLTLCLAGFYALAVFVNLLSALLALAGMLYYVVFYSLALKKKTTHNIVIGGGAGAIPPLVGWAAATGSLTAGAFFLFALIFFWTPPHFWALALVRRRDYARAGIPMLPVIYGERQTRREIFLYTLQVVALTMLLPVSKMGGWLFAVLAMLLGSVLLAYAWRLLRAGGNRTAWGLYRYSSLYLALIFGALVLDTLI